MSPTATEPEAANEAGLFDPTEPDPVEAEQPPNTSLWHGSDGMLNMTVGVALPILIIITSSIICFERIIRMTIKHPVETLVECALVLLVPFANYYAWKAIRNNDGRRPLRIGVMNGAAMATSFLGAGVIAGSVFAGYPTNFMLLAALAFAVGCSSLYIGWRLRNTAGTRQGRANRLLFSGLGVVLSVAGLVACEAKGTAIRIAETMALSDSIEERDKGLSLLRQMNCEQDLRMQCADVRLAGIPGMFWRISPEREREVYFAVNGKPYGNSLTESVYSMSDEYLRRHVVGTPIKGLALRRSQMAGYVNGQTLTSTLNWTFVFKNNTFSDQEARAEIAVPPGAVISDLTLWKDGSAHPAMIGPTDRVQGSSDQSRELGSYSWVDTTYDDPAVLTDLGRGRALLKCAAVPPQGELKAQITFTQRLKPLALNQGSLTLPRFVDTNFALEGDHSLRLHSAEKIALPSDSKNLHVQPAADGGDLLVGTLSDLDGATLNVPVSRQPSLEPLFVRDKRSGSGGYIKETIKQVQAAAPDHLVIVVDNSQSMKAYVGALVDALEKMPSNVKTSVVLPTAGQQMEPVELKKGIELIKNAKFDGGKDNLQAVVKAAEAAGETHRGAVLWVHGPQPNLNQEMYIMAPYIERPSFYELALDDRFTDTNEFFKNHREIGPFVTVPRSAGVMDDLRAFLGKWRTGGTEFVVQLDRDSQLPAHCKEVTGPAADELIRLCSRDDCFALLRENRLGAAARLASATRIVTPVSGAAVLRRSYTAAPQSDAQQTAWLQGMTNGTVSTWQYDQHVVQQLNALNQYSAVSTPGRLMSNGSTDDATVISGINTAGTVRVNNLANLEALLSILANAGEILGLGCGACLLIGAAIDLHYDREKHLRNVRAAWGVACIAGALWLPGFINYMVASARDANLFS